MPKNKQAFERYKVIDKYLQDQEGCTTKQLQQFCENELFVKVSLRTIQNDLIDMANIFDAPIKKCKEAGHYHYTNSSFSIFKKALSEADRKQLSAALSTLSRFAGYPQFDWVNTTIVRLKDELKLPDTENIVCFEDNFDLKGRNHIDTLYDFICKQKTANIEYKPYNQKVTKRIIFPYYLKQYNNRWFLFAGEKDSTELINLALDRIQKITSASKVKYQPKPAELDFEEYFDDIIGVTHTKGSQPEKITLWATANRWPYIQTKPLHSSQTEIKNPDNLQKLQKAYPTLTEGVFFTIEVCRNKELGNTILFFGNDLLVLNPTDFRDELRTNVMNTASRYNELERKL